ncbi:hypothetical protein U1Q18_009253 [Sarracenia purpurea var. burkii]
MTCFSKSAARGEETGEGGGVSRCSWGGGEGTERGEEAAGSSVVAAGAAGASATGPSSTGTSVSSTAAGFST